MIQIKYGKCRYRNTSKKEKAAFRGRGFQANSKSYQSIMNLTKQIIQRREKNHTIFLKKFEKTGKNIRRRRYECQ